ncbi:hypothetical protein F5X97DRAFT_191377 [Nemania serpens]|nr:hypothetical protein F5X97DRAFT_191377 [Nemania serpens]
MPLAPPPDGTVFPTWDECFRAVQSFAAHEGYAVTAKGQAKKKETGLYRRYVIRCDRSGSFKSHAQLGVRRTSSKKTNCPFSAACNIRPDGCFLRVLKPEHNHPPSQPAVHVQHRRLTDEQRQLIEARALERKSIRLIWAELKTIDPNTYITYKDVDNAVQRFRKRAKDDATGVQAIIYKLVERPDLFCFTLERSGVQGAFWVPRWSTEPWMRPNGTPDILVMLAEHIANRPVLPILEMNSVLNIAGFGHAQQTRARPDDPVNFNPSAESNPASSPGNPVIGSNNINNSSESPAMNPTVSSDAQSALRDTGRSSNGLDGSLGAGYAILPDKTDATLLWLRSAVELLRQRIPQCPKPRFITMTDFQTGEKNIMVEVSKGGAQHRQMHIVFGRVLVEDDDNPTLHGAKSRKSREERAIGAGANATEGEDDDEDDDDDEEQADGDGGQEDDDDEDGDHDMDGDHDSDAEIARQLTGATTQNDQDPQNSYRGHDQNQNQNQNQSQNQNQTQNQNLGLGLGLGYNLTPPRNPELPQPHGRGPRLQNPMAGVRLPLPAPPQQQRHPALQGQQQQGQQPPVHSAYNPPMVMSRLPGQMVPARRPHLT